MIKINKSIVIGVVLGIVFVWGIGKCRDVWKARQREKQIEAIVQAEREFDKAMRQMGKMFKGGATIGGSLDEKAKKEALDAIADLPPAPVIEEGCLASVFE